MSTASGIWIVPRNLTESSWFLNTATLQDHREQIHALAQNCMYRAKFRDATSWTGRRSKRRIPLQESSWFTYLTYRIVADPIQFGEKYVRDIPKKEKSGEFNPHFQSYVHFESLTHPEFRTWVDQSEIRKRKNRETRKARKSKRNEVEFFISSSDHGKVECSFTIRFDVKMLQKRKWSLLETGAIVLSDEFEKVRTELDTINQGRHRTPLASGEIEVSPERAAAILQGQNKDLSHQRLAYQVFESDFPEALNPRHFRLNTRWVETLMGLPVNTTNPLADNLTETYALKSQATTWRNNG
mgnify:CR=1 FL=1